MRALFLIIILLYGSTAAGQQLKSITNSIGMKLVLIHAGSFAMGSQIGTPGRSEAESLHEVTISNSYYIGACEVTQEHYEGVVGHNPSRFRGRQLPVEMVNWLDAISFCKKLSELPEENAAGREYRLPTESEWEYSCRARSGAAYSFGDAAELLGDYSWFDGNAERQTHPVGQKRANRWGLYDMHGNVCEWCQDWYEFYPSIKEIDPTGPIGGSLRVRRGGSWRHDAKFCGAAYRYASEPQSRSPDCGFRVALSRIVNQPTEKNYK